MRVLVKGAGVAGLAAAHALAIRGADVVVIEKEASLAGSASWLAGGMLAHFCERESAEEAVVTLGRQAAGWWQEAVPGAVSFNGTLLVAPRRDAAETKRFAARTRGYTPVGAAEIAALEPDLGGRFDSGLYFAEEAHLDPRRVLSRLRDSLADRGVAFFFDGTQPPDRRRFDATVDCTGMGAAAQLAELRGVRGEMLYLHTRDVSLSRPVRLLHPRIPVYIVPRGDGLFMVGATMVESASDDAISARSLMELLNAAYTLHPAFGEARVVETASGVRPAYPDNLPRVTTKADTVFINGFYRHGFLLAPALATEAADIVLRERAAREEA